MHLLLGILCFLTGITLLLIALAELLWNTFLEGGPPISRRVAHSAFRLTISFCRGKNRSIIGLAGLVAIISVLLLWTMLVWMGWALIFSGSQGAVVDAITRRPADEIDRLYFAGSTIFTLGIGDYQPVGHFWQLATSVAAGSGFLMFGTALAYLMAVVPAATQKRQLAVVIWALGKSPDDIILRAWNGADSTALSPHLISLIPMLALTGESHLSYPILHYIHSTKRSASLAASVASLDEALTILECGLQRGCSLDLPSLGAAREAITEFLKTLDGALISPSKQDPPAPSLKMLKEMGVSVVDDDLFKMSLAGLTERRRMLHALVRNEGWTWMRSGRQMAKNRAIPEIFSYNPDMAALIECQARPMAPFELAAISQQLSDDVSRLVPDSNGYSVEDYFKLDGPYLVEYVEGCLQVLPLPDTLHQALIILLLLHFRQWLKRDPQGRAIMSPFKVYLDERRYREPDVAVMLGKNAHRRTNKFWRGADLAVEIISETNRQHDVVTKMTDYANAGIPEYWIVDPEAKSISVFVLTDGTYQQLTPAVEMQSCVMDGLVINVNDLFDQAMKEA